MAHPIVSRILSLLARALALPDGPERRELLREAIDLTDGLARD